MSDFVHLHLHSEYSVTHGICKVGSIIDECKAQGMQRVTITDSGAMFGAVKLVQKAEAANIKPILAAEVFIESKDEKPHGRIVLLAENEEGYNNLSKLISRAQIENKSDKTGIPLIKQSWITRKTASGLFCLTGGYRGFVNVALEDEMGFSDKITEEALNRLMFLKKYFEGSMAVELTRCHRPQEEDQLHLMVQMASYAKLPVVATNDVEFMKPDDFEAHDVRQMIATGENANQVRRQRPYSREQYFKTEAEMLELFDDIPQAVHNAGKIAQRCNFKMQLGKSFLPRFETPEGYVHYPYEGNEDRRAMVQHLNVCETEWREKGNDEDQIHALRDESELLISESWYGLDRRWPAIEQYYHEEGFAPDAIRAKYEEYVERTIIELEIITRMGFPGYYLIVKDFIQWSKNNDIPVGAGRGSGAGSLVAFSVDITDLDPLPYDLLFERFLNPERVSMPDFDIDFCMNRRGEVIDYVSERYGSDRVGQIATTNTMAAKMVIKDVARALGFNYMMGDNISQQISKDPGTKLQDALDESDVLIEMYHNDDDVKEIVDTALKLEGMTRAIGKHAGGVLIAPDDITKFSPMYAESEGATPTSQFDKNDVESAGLVKFDFLGLKTLTVVQDAVKHIRRRGEEAFDIRLVSMKDEKTFDLLKSAKTTAVFQLESTGMQKIVRDMKPSCFEDLVALVALFRPGPLQSGMVDDFINRKHGRQQVSYPHQDYQLESLKPVLEPTYGIILYQEQVMQIAQVMAGYTLGQADLLRRAMGKKKPEEMAKQRGFFLEGCERNDIDIDLAGNIFDLVEKFAGYGFNKSHSAGYGLLSYQTAYLKAHYPVEFMSAVLSSEADKHESLIHFMGEVKRMGVEILNPDINKSRGEFLPNGDNQILFGFDGIKGVGESAVAALLNERDENGPYTSLLNMVERLDGKGVSKTVFKSLIGAGALDAFGDRSYMIGVIAEHVDQYKAFKRYQDKLAAYDAKERETGKRPKGRLKVIEWPPAEATDVEMISRHDLLLAERAALGTFISEHPYRLVKAEADQYQTHTLRQLVTTDPDWLRQQDGAIEVRISGIVVSAEEKKTRRSSILLLHIDDGEEMLEIPIFGRDIAKYQPMLERSMFKPILIRGQMTQDRDQKRVTIRMEDMEPFETIRDRHARMLLVNRCIPEGGSTEMSDSLRETLLDYQNGHTLVVFQDKHADGRLVKWPLKMTRVVIRDDLLEALDRHDEVDSVRVIGAVDQERRVLVDNIIVNLLGQENNDFMARFESMTAHELQQIERDRTRQRNSIVSNIDQLINKKKGRHSNHDAEPGL